MQVRVVVAHKRGRDILLKPGRADSGIPAPPVAKFGREAGKFGKSFEVAPKEKVFKPAEE